MKSISYRVQLIGVLNSDELPMNVTITVENEDAPMFEQYLLDEAGNIFARACGGNVEF